eukprot:g26555.t1
MRADDKKPTAKKQPVFAKADLEFFESKVRPLLKARCYQCHSGESKEIKAGLRLDSRVAVLKGGETGPAAVAGKPEKSNLIEAIRYEGLEMPPRSKLPAGEIAILTRWVKLGLPWPKESAPKTAVPQDVPFPLAERKQSHWAWKPIQRPISPPVRKKGWANSAIDRFILARLESGKIEPAKRATRRVLIRRATFDLIGLPPSPQEVTEFVNDPAPTDKAFAKVVDRLLKSPHFGERWGRHWLDLVRYGETLGHEFDYPLHHAHQYRDYVIRALNADVPYDSFVTEHIAGDLMKNPRRHPELGFNESVIGTGFWFLGEDKHAPVDVKGEEAAKIDNRLDVFSKTFLGLTVACARCHDHKFDAISTKDYYALAGFLQSSHQRVALLDPQGTIGKRTTELARLKLQGEQLILNHTRQAGADRLRRDITNLLLASRKVARVPRRRRARAIKQAAAAFAVDAGALKRLVAALNAKEVNQPSHPLWLWKQFQRATDAELAERRGGWYRQIDTEIAKWKSSREQSKLFADFNSRDFDRWRATGFAFGDAPTQPGEWDMTAPDVRPALPGVVRSDRWSRKLGGVLRSPTFTLEHDEILYRVRGKNARIRLVIDGYVMDAFSGLLFRGATQKINTPGKWIWQRQAGDIHRYKGHRSHIEIVDDGNGWVAVDEIRFVNRGRQNPHERPFELFSKPQVKSAAELAGLYAAELVSWHRRDETGKDSEQSRAARFDSARLLQAASRAGLLDSIGTLKSLTDLRAAISKVDASIPQPMRVLAITDGSSEDEHVFIRGNHKTLGPVVPRRMLEAISGANQPRIVAGSGRLELARRILDPANPFPARVMVNRVWHHLFGRGIVASVDNFGVLGQKPTHPELLDHLAGEFIRDGWSIKRLIRRVMLSSVYQQSSSPQAEAVSADPQNRLLHHMPVRRLESEAIRDAMLAISGRLDRTLFGPSVPVHLTRFMQGRGRPRQNGPLDGQGRRSLYIAVRRNFLPPMMLAFDTPIPFNTIGRRNVSNVPAQALILMNDPFVIQQAGLWAKRVLAEEQRTPEERIGSMYETAFARPPAPEEIDRGIACRRGIRLWLGRDDSAADGATESLCPHRLFQPADFRSERGADVDLPADAKDGSWTTPNAVGINALIATALLKSGVPADDPAVAKVLKHLKTFVKKDGGIYYKKSNHRNYETCISMLAFDAANKKGEYDQLIKNGEKFLRKLQWDEGEGLESSDESFGGAGYGSHQRPDLSNTQFLIEALKTAGVKPDDKAMKNALKFVSRAQNLESEHNTTKFAAKINDGGFYYTPAAGGTSQAGKNADGGLRSYGSMTYAGLKSMIYAGVSKDDPRVKAAYKWIQRSYTLRQNPGMGQQGLYYYFHTFAKALDVLNVNEFVDAKGAKHDWRKDLTDRLGTLQRENGSWVNRAERCSEQAVSVVAGTWRAGLAGIWWQFLWLWATPFYWIVAPVMRRMRALTTSDFFEARYGPATATLYSAFGIITSIVFIAAGLYGSGKMVNALTGGELETVAQDMNITLPEVEARGERGWFQAGRLGEVPADTQLPDVAGPAGALLTHSNVEQLDKGKEVPKLIRTKLFENDAFLRRHRPLSENAVVKVVKPEAEWQIVDEDSDRTYQVVAVKTAPKDGEPETAIRVYASGWRLMEGYELAIIAMTIMFVSYGMAGGLGAAIITDFVQGILTITFSFLLLPYVFDKIGGAGALNDPANSSLKEGMLSLVASKDVAEIVGREPITIFYIFMLSLTALAGIVVQPHIMGVCGAGKTEFEGRFGFTFGNFIKRFCTMAWTFTGLACIVWYLGANSPLLHDDKPLDQKSAAFQQLSEEKQAAIKDMSDAERAKIVSDRATYDALKKMTRKDFKDLPQVEQERAKAIDKDFADELFGRAAYEILGSISPGLIGLLLASLLAAIMSSSDAQMVVSSGLFTENIYKRFLLRNKSQRHYLWVGRISGLLIVLLALIVQASFTDVIDALRVVIKTPAILGISLWCGIVWRGWTPLAVWISAAACAATWAFTAYFPQEIASFAIDISDTREINLHFLMNEKLTKVSDAWQMASFMTVGVVVGFVVSMVTPRTPSDKLDHFFRLIHTPVRKGEEVEAPCTLPADPLPPVEKIFNYDDIELPKPTWVGFGGFVAAWVLVGAIIGLTYYLANTL